jgi:aerobic-type carbon monoxide dehydrogenase small subunit (CoxS/CutS family)
MSTTLTTTFTLDGRERTFSVVPHETLLRLLRREGIWSVRFGSDTGETGAAAILFDGELASADVILAAQAHGHEITTVETLNAGGDELHPIQKAFMVTGALQSAPSPCAVPTRRRRKPTSATCSAASSTARPRT